MEQLVRTFDNYTAAEQARAALVSAGFSTDWVQLTSTGDEAGAVQGNFTVGDSPRVSGGDDYNDVYRPTAQLGHFIMTVEAPSPSEADRAAAILEGHGARSGDPGSAAGAA